MPSVQPATHKSRANINEETLEFEPSWKSVPFDDYDDMTQQQFQDAIAPFVLHGKLVPITVPKGWRRVETARPGKHMYVHIATGTISAFPKEIFDCRQNQWITKEGQIVPEEDVLAPPAQRALKLAYPNGVPKDAEQPAPSAAPAPPEAARAPRPQAPVAPALPVGLLFPGQGSQYVKMMADVAQLPKVREMLKQAEQILGYSIEDICMRGPEEKLEQTKFCQPAMYIAGLAAIEKLRAQKPERVERCQAVAGLSLGEYSALAVAGVFDFETGLKLVKVRAEAMQDAADASPQGMISIAGLDEEVVARLCKESIVEASDVCQIANFLFPKGFSCSGTQAAIERLEEKAKGTPDCLQARILKTSGAFHTSLMQPAKEQLLEALRAAGPNMQPPRCDVYMNTTGKKIAAGTPPSELIDMLGEQLVSCVQWEPSVKEMLKDGVTEFYECGPMKQLKAMMKRIDQDAWKGTTNVDV